MEQGLPLPRRALWFPAAGGIRASHPPRNFFEFLVPVISVV
jgi:hypothetical protein